jgi:predicted RNA binding protein YcfA (HicA-like mRNA interferase family)
MSDKVPCLSGKEVIKALVKLGYTVHDQKGSHIHLRHPVRKPLTIPNHAEIARGTLRVIIKDAGLTIEEFTGLLS